MLRKTKAVDMDGATYVVKELTPAEIDALFDVSTKRQRTIIDDMLDVHNLDTVLLGSMLGVDPEKCGEIIGQKTPSEYGPLIAAAKEINPDFFEMARRRIAAVGHIEAMERVLATISASPSASSLPTATPTPGTTE